MGQHDTGHKSSSNLWKQSNDPDTTREHKARLVIHAQALTMKRPVVRYNRYTRYLFSLAVRYDLDIQQVDAVTTFLYGDLSGKIYMLQPPSFLFGNNVCLSN